MVATIALTLTATIALIFYLGYQHGAINLNWYFQTYARYPFEFMAKNVLNPSELNLNGWIYRGVGAAVMAVLLVVHHRFLWWPFHPLGFPVSLLFGTVFFSVLLAWLIKTVVIKYGGPQLYLKTRPFFLGLILGQFVTAGFWLAVSHFTKIPGGYNYLSGYF